MSDCSTRMFMENGISLFGVGLFLGMSGTKRTACMKRRLGKNVVFDVKGLAAIVASDNKMLNQTCGDKDHGRRLLSGLGDEERSTAR